MFISASVMEDEKCGLWSYANGGKRLRPVAGAIGAEVFCPLGDYQGSIQSPGSTGHKPSSVQTLLQKPNNRDKTRRIYFQES